VLYVELWHILSASNLHECICTLYNSGRQKGIDSVHVHNISVRPLMVLEP